MPLSAINFVPKGPVKSADINQFFNLFTGVMVDQPVTFKNVLTVGGNQGTTTVPVKLYGAVGQTTHLIDLYTDNTNANPGWGIAASGQMGWGPGGAAPQDTTLSRVARQNGHASDTAGLLVSPYLEVAGQISAVSYLFSNSATLTGPAANPFYLLVNNTLAVNSINERLRISPAAPQFFVMESTDMSVQMWAKLGVGLAYNEFYDGTNWQRYDTAQPINALSVEPTGVVVRGAPSGTNPITTFTQLALIDTAGGLTLNSGVTVNLARGPNQGGINLHAQLQANDASIFAENGNIYFWLSQASPPAAMVFQSNVAGTPQWSQISCGTINSQGYLYTTDGSQNGVVANPSGTLYLRALGNATNAGTGTVVTDSTGGLTVANQLRTSMSLWLNGTNGIGGAISGACYYHPNGTVYSYLNASNTLYFQNLGLSCTGAITSGTNGFFNAGAQYTSDGNVSFYKTGTTGGQHWFQNLGGAGWAPVAGGPYSNNSSIKDKLDVRPIEDPLSLVMDEGLHGIRYTDRLSGEHRLGFVADAWVERVPEIVQYFPDSQEILGMNYDRVGAITFEAVKHLAARVAELEARLAA